MRATTTRPRASAAPRRAQRRAATVLAGLLALAVAAPASVGSYTIRPGDTLGAIARQHGTTISALAAANGITDVNRIIAGRTLQLPGAGGAPAVPPPPAAAPAPAGGGQTYVIAAGDTLSGIARRFAVTVRALADANGITDVNRIRAGVRLTIPGSDLTTTPTPPAARAGVDASRFPERLRTSPERLALVPHFQRWAGEYGVPVDLLMAMTWLESGWQNQVVSHVGAQGIGQLMPATVDFVSDVLLRTRLDPAVPDQNIRMSARYLAWLLERTGGDERLALAGYYQGLASVRARGVFAVSEAYVANVQTLRARHFA